MTKTTVLEDEGGMARRGDGVRAVPDPRALEPRQRSPRAKARLRLVAFALLVVACLVARPIAQHWRAASLLMTFADTTSRPEVIEEQITFDREGASTPARLYRPTGIAHPPGVVLVHGVHHLGIDEPRLERFARAIASVGVAVMTPAVTELSDYRVAPRSIGTVGAAALDLRRRLGTETVGVMGMSFGGGISLLAAADPRFADAFAFVVAVGAHDDLGRVSRFFVDSEIPMPDGGTQKLRAHGYGMMVLVHAHVEDFFAAEDVPGARDALRLWLQEERDAAKKALAQLSPGGRQKLEALFGEAAEAAWRGPLLAELESHTHEMAEVSPHGRLGGLKARVYLLHGEGDSVIPKTETLWLAKDVPSALLESTLVTPAIEHVEPRASGLSERWALVHFLGSILAEAERTR